MWARPPCSVVEHERLAVRPESAHPGAAPALDDGGRETVRLDQLDRAMLDQPGLHPRSKLNPVLRLEEHVRDAGVVKATADDKPCGAKPTTDTTGSLSQSERPLNAPRCARAETTRRAKSYAARPFRRRI
jgi:hypothetical protein